MSQRISVVMATYNGVRFLREQLDSLFVQTRMMDELIVYDDASEDETVSILRDYQRRYPSIVRIYIQKQRAGYIQNFADALRMAEGEIIFLCDQDDIWNPDKIEIMSMWLETHPKADCLNSAVDYVDEQGSLLKAPPQKMMIVDEYTEISFSEILLHNISMGCTMAFRKTIRNSYLQTSSFQSAHDWEINMIAAARHTLYYVNQPLMRYRIHDANTTGDDRMNHKNHIYASQREKNAQAMLAYIHACRRYDALMDETQIKQLQECEHFYEQRYALLHEHKLRAWFYCIARIRFYHRVVSYRGMLVDFLYAGKHNKLEKES